MPLRSCQGVNSARSGLPAPPRIPADPVVPDRSPGIDAVKAAVPRPRVPERGPAPPWSARRKAAAAVFALGMSLVAYAYLAYFQRGIPWRFVDLDVYHDAGVKLRQAPSQVYTRDFGSRKLPFLYPPFAAYLFRWAAAGGVQVLAWGMTLLSIACLGVIAWLAAGLAGHRKRTRRIALTATVAAMAIWTEPVQHNLFVGQVNLVLVTLVITDFALPAGHWARGVGIGLAAGIKLTPGIFVLYLLITGRVRAACTAVAVFAGTVGAGWLLMPGASERFWTQGSLSGARLGPDYLASPYNQSLLAAAVRLVGNVSVARALWMIASVVVLVAGFAAARVFARHGRDLTGVLVVALVSLLVSPIAWTHHWVWLVVALVPLTAAAVSTPWRWWRAPRLALVSVVLLCLPLPFVVTDHRLRVFSSPQPFWALVNQWGASGYERRYSVCYVVGNAYVFTGLAALAVAVIAARRVTLGTRNAPVAPDVSRKVSVQPESRAHSRR